MKGLIPRHLIENIITNEMIGPQIYRMIVKSPYISENAVPGQFVNIRCSEGLDAILRRPISICSVDRAAGTFDIVFQVRGKGTQLLAHKQANDTIDLLGPLGNGFQTGGEYKKIAVVGGGIGIFPLLFLLKEDKSVKKNVFLGFRSGDSIVLEDEFKVYADTIFITTDDGAAGRKGVVTEPLEEEMQKGGFDMVYTCGPLPMMKKVVEIAQKYRVRCQVSLEERMGCGIGACLVCACKTKYGEEWEYSHVCKDGPVFWSEDVIFE